MKFSNLQTAFVAITLALGSSLALAQNAERPGHCYNQAGCSGRDLGFIYYSACVRYGGVSWKNWDTRECVSVGSSRYGMSAKSSALVIATNSQRN